MYGLPGSRARTTARALSVSFGKWLMLGYFAQNNKQQNMAKRNIIELSAQLSVGQAIEAMKALRTACEATGKELDGFYGEFAQLQNTAATRSLTLDEEKRLKQLQKQIKDTEVVYKSMMQTVSEDRRAISAIGKAMSEGLEKQTGTSLRRVIKEAEQKLMNFIGKEREMKVKVILEDGSESFMNVTSRQLVEIKQKAKARLAGAQIGSGDTLAESEAWLNATRKMTDAQRKAQEQEQEFHSTNMQNIKAEMEAKRKAAEDAALQVKTNERAVQELEAKRKDRQQQGAGTSGPNKVTEQSVADAAARLAEEERKTADLEAKRVELQHNLAEAQAKVTAAAKEQLEVSQKQVQTEEQRRQRIDAINVQMAKERGMSFAEYTQNKVDVKASTSEDYAKYKAEYVKRMQMREDADFLDAEKKKRAAILESRGVVKTDPLGITSVAATYDDAKHQLFLIQEAMKQVQSSASASVVPEKYKEMKAYLDEIGGELDAIAEKARAAGVDINEFMLGKAKENAKAVSQSMQRMFDAGGAIKEEDVAKVDASFASIKQAMSAVRSGENPNFGSLALSIDDRKLKDAIRNAVPAQKVQVSNVEKPGFMSWGLDELKRSLSASGMAEDEVKAKLAEAEKKLQDPQMLKDYEAYYNEIIAGIERTLSTHDKKVQELKKEYGKYQNAKGEDVYANAETTASNIRALAKSGKGEGVSGATLQQIREKLGIRGGTQKTIAGADGTSQVVTEGAVPLAEGDAEQRLLALLQERAVLEGKVVEAKAAGNAASSETVARINREIEANEQAIAQQKQAEEQARKMSEAQSNTLSANKEYAEAQERLTQSLERAGKAEDEYEEYQRQTADSLAESEKYLRDNDAAVIKNADDMRNYINTLQIQAPLLAKNAEEFARYQKAINEMKQRYAEFTENTRNNMKNLGKASDATLAQLRNHFQSIITTSGASAKEIKAAQRSIDQIDKEQHKRSMASATAPITSRATIGELQKRVQEAQQLQKSTLTTRTEWKRLQTVIDQGSASLRAFNQERAKVQATKDMKALATPSAMSDAEIAQATKRLQDYAATSKLTADEREKLNKAIAAGNAELERKQGGDNAVRLAEQYRALTSSVDGLSKASDEALRKQSAFWLQQSAHAQAGTAQYEQAIKRYRQMADEMTRRQDVQRWELLNGQLGGADRVDVLMGRTGGATEQQIRAAIEQTTLLNKQTDITSAKYAENAQLIARGNHMLGEQKRLQEEAAKAEEQARLRADAQSVEGDLTRATKQQLDILKQMYAERLQLDERDTAARDHLIAINREEQRRLELQKQIAAEASKIGRYELNEMLSNPLRYTSEQVDRAIRQGEQQVRKLTGMGLQADIEQARQLAVAIDQAREAQRRFNEENQRAVMQNKLDTSLSAMSGSALAEQEKYWRAQIEGAKRGSAEATKFADNLRMVRDEQRLAAQQQLGIKQAGGTLTDTGRGMIANIMSGTLTTIEQMKQAKQVVEEFKAKFADTRDTEGMKILDQAIAQVTHDLAVAEKGIVSLDDVSAQLEAKAKARKDEAEKLAKGEEVKNPTQNFSQPEIERMSRSLREAYQYYEAMGDTEGIERTQRAMGMLTAETERTRQSAASLAAGEQRIAAAIANPRAEKSLKVLQAAYQQLKQKIDNANDSHKAYMENAGKLREINMAIQQVTRSMEHQKSVAERVKAALVSHWGIYLNLATIIQQVQSMIMGNVQLSDSMTNVQKVTSMTNSELTTMTRKLEELDTRTSQLDLMKLAEQAGKLGIYGRGGVQAMTEFVDVANRITSTLGEDIGGAEAVDSLVKVNDLVNKDSGMSLYESLSRIGSGILSVGNNSAASYADVVNFVNQVGAVGSVSGVSMEQLIALGGTFSSLGAAMDQSATSINKLLVGLQRNAAKVASVTGQSAAELQSLIASGDAFEALLSVVERVHEMGGNTAQTIYEILDQFGGRKNAQMFTAMALLIDNASRLREEMFYASQGYQENTLMASEYSRVQENLAGVLARIGNSIKEAFMNPGVQEAMKFIVEVLGKIVESLIRIIPIIKWPVVILAIASAWRAASVAIGEYLIAQKGVGAVSFLQRIKDTFKYLGYWLMQFVPMRKNIEDTKKAMAELHTISFGWFTAISIGFTAAVAAILKFKHEQDELNKIQGEYSSTIGQNISQSNALFGALERTIDPLQKAQEEHRKTAEALDKVTAANKEGKASFDDVKRAEEENRNATDALNQAKNNQATALNAVNAAYGNTLKLSAQDLNNAYLLEAAHKRVAAAIREEAAARMSSKMRESITNNYADRLSEAEGKLTNSAYSLGENGTNGDAMSTYARSIANEYIDRAKQEGKSPTAYMKKVTELINKEYENLFNKKVPEHYEFTQGGTAGGGGAYVSSATDKLIESVREYMNLYSEFNAEIDRVERNAQSISTSNRLMSDKENMSALSDYKKRWEQRKAGVEQHIANLKATSESELHADMAPLEGYTKLYGEMLKKSPQLITENVTDTFNEFRSMLSRLEGALREKLATQFWSKDGLTPGKMSDDTLVKNYNKFNDWHNKLTPDMDVANALPDLWSEYGKNFDGMSEEQIRQQIRARAKELKDEMDRRGINTSGKFKWTEGGDGGKNKWKQEAKDQYNAYIKELDDFYARQKTELEQQRADGLMKENEFNARVEELDKEHYYNRAKLRNMFMEDAKRDARTGLLSDPTINRIYGDGKMMEGDIANWKNTFEKTRSLINRLGDAFVDEVKLKSTEDRLKVAQILRKAQDELEKAIIEGDPMAKVMADYEDSLDKMHQIFGMEDWMSGNEHSDEEYHQRLEILRGYSAQINSTSKSEFINQISQVKEFAGRTIEEYQLLYDSLLQLREDYDEAARKQAKKDLKLMDARVENGQYYKEQLAMYESRLQSMDWASPEAQSVMSMVEMLRKRQNVRDANGKEVSYNARQKARLEAAKKQVEREQAVSNSGVGNSMGLASAQLGEARQELAIAYDLLTARRSYMDATVAETERELAALRERGAALQEINAKEADLAALKVMQGEAITEANEKVEESERKLAEAEAGMLSARIQNANDWNNIFIEFNKSLASAGDSQAESNAFKIAEIKARKSLGLYKETMRQRYLIIKQNGQYEEKWMTEEESLLMDNRIAAENEMKQATEKMLNDFGEKMAKNITEAFQRIMELQVEQEKEQQKQQAITNEQKQGIDQRMVNEQNYTTFYKNELALRLQETREFYRQLNTLTAGSPSVVLGTQQTTSTPIGTMPGDILNHMEGTAADSETARAGVMPGDIASQLYGGENLMSEWTTAAEASDAYYNHVVSAEAQANEQRTKSHAKMVSAMSSAMNMYGIVYGAVMNDNLTASQKAKQIALQATGQMIISMLTASLSQAGADASTGLARAISKAFGELGPIGGAAAIAGITAVIGGAMAVASSKVAKSKKQVAAATGAGAGKLTTGMLTYADGRYPGEAGFSEGGTYNVPGADGKTYNARYEGNISKTGIRRGTHFGIFSEKKPEMVIDGNTTELIHKKYPQVESFILQMSKYRQAHPLPQINHALIQRSAETISRTRAMGLAGAGSLVARTYAAGNVEEVARAMSSAATSASGTQGGTQEQVAQQAQVLAQLSATVAQLQRTLAAGIRADISSKSFAKAKRFEQRNGIRDGLAD